MSNLPKSVSSSPKPESPVTGSLVNISPLSSSVFNSPDKNSIPELKIRNYQAITAQRAKMVDLLTPTEESSPFPWDQINPQLSINMGKVLRPIPVYPVTPPKENPVPARAPASLSAPPPGCPIPESLVRDILTMVKKEYPWAEAILASKMSNEQFNLVLNKLPQLKHIILSRMPKQVVPRVNPARVVTPTKSPPKKKEERKLAPALPMKFIEFLYQIKKFTEVGLLDEDLLDEPLSPMTMSMIHSMLLQVKKLAELHRAQLEGKPKNLEEELAIRRRLKEVREYIREEQKSYIETLNSRPDAEKPTMEQIFKKWF